MFKTRALAAALILATLGAALATAPASAGADDPCRQQGFRTIVNHVWHKYVWVREKVGKHWGYRLMDCGPENAF